MNQAEIDAILNVHLMAFGDTEGPEITALAKELIARPDTISISVTRDQTIVGNVLFTPYAFQEHPDVRCYLLAPCGVSREYQGRGVGKELMESSIQHLKSVGADAVFVLGVPSFYPRYGFVPTDKQTPYPDLLTIPESWMALELKAGAVQPLSGITTAVEPFMRPELWDTSAYG